jgi:hypothetical protein
VVVVVLAVLELQDKALLAEMLFLMLDRMSTLVVVAAVNLTLVETETAISKAATAVMARHTLLISR